MISHRKKYTKEFKENAVRLAEESKMSVKEIAADLGIHPNMLYRWRSKMLKEQGDFAPGNGNVTSEEKELRTLKRKIADLEMERDILKKALGIFSKHPK